MSFTKQKTNIKKVLKYGITLSTIFVFTVSCSQEDEDIVNELEANTQQLSEKTSGGSCGSVVDFEDLVIETSWISEDKNDRDTYNACGVDGESWYDKYNDGRVMMKCLADDGHRTELKENSGDEANLSNYKRIKFTAKYSSIPENGVTIAQIHNRADNIKRPWLRLYIDDDRKFKIKETETTPTSSSSDYTTYTGMQYASNGEVEITVWTGISGDEKAKIRVDYNGNRFEKTLYHSSAWNNYDDHFYLKAGVYTEGNDKQAKVTYSSFDVIH